MVILPSGLRITKRFRIEARMLYWGLKAYSEGWWLALRSTKLAPWSRQRHHDVTKVTSRCLRRHPDVTKVTSGCLRRHPDVTKFTSGCHRETRQGKRETRGEGGGGPEDPRADRGEPQKGGAAGDKRKRKRDFRLP